MLSCKWKRTIFTLPDPSLQRIERRLDELGRLEAGWLDGQGEAIEEISLRSAREIVERCAWLRYRSRIYPTIEGGVVFELWRWAVDLSVECLPTGEVEISGLLSDGETEIDPVRWPRTSEVPPDVMEHLVQGESV